MKTLKLFLLACLPGTNVVQAQNSGIDRFLALKPSEINTVEQGPYEYDVTLKWQNLDALSGDRISCNAICGTYVTGIQNDFVAWKDVSLSDIRDLREKPTAGTPMPTFEGFTYKQYDTGCLTEDFYTSIAPEHRDIAKWLVSDALQMQGLAWYVFDSLEFNREFIPKMLDHYDIKFENWVTFSSRYQRLLWSGITRYNNEICAVVKFESCYNPVEMNTETLSFKGRSLYWGEMWISLEDKQVEYATMFEDVVFKLKSAAFPEEQLLDLQREVIFDKVL
jgi:hypothetical protein